MCSVTGYVIAALGALQLLGVTTVGSIAGGEATTGALLLLAGVVYALVARRTCASGRCAVPSTEPSRRTTGARRR